jgi:hypothetical protein
MPGPFYRGQCKARDAAGAITGQPRCSQTVGGAGLDDTGAQSLAGEAKRAMSPHSLPLALPRGTLGPPVPSLCPWRPSRSVA